MTCSVCGRENAADARFCSGCGTKLTEAPSAGATDVRAYTPRHLAEKILTSRAALEGERKQVTVLFADVKGSLGEAWSARSATISAWTTPRQLGLRGKGGGRV